MGQRRRVYWLHYWDNPKTDCSNDADKINVPQVILKELKYSKILIIFGTLYNYRINQNKQITFKLNKLNAAFRTLCEFCSFRSNLSTICWKQCRGQARHMYQTVSHVIATKWPVLLIHDWFHYTCRLWFLVLVRSLRLSTSPGTRPLLLFLFFFL